MILSDIHVDGQLKIYCGNEAYVEISAGSTFVETSLFCAWKKIVIGKDCMFSWGINIHNHDGHPIFDYNSGSRINYPEDIILGDHVWVGMGCTILHGANIESGSVIGADSLVTNHKFPKNCILAGSPAKVIKKDVCWVRDWDGVVNPDFL